ncbi:MAG TPA: FHA domain-containing protein [Casimicrobiaceae bacterium]|nr:FHA domain-containing protein [Casimicrobiaceae bacterium]
MMWVEILSRHHDVIERYRVDGQEARIGRAYDNDVVIDDPFVAPHHLVIFRADDGVMVAEDQGSQNGLFDVDGARVKHAAVDGRRAIRIGRTHLRVRDGLYAVPPERRAQAPTKNGRTATLLAVLVAGFTLLELWLGQTEEVRTSTWLAPLIIYVGLIIAWSTSWALLSRLFGGAARFTTHLAIALAAALLFHLYDWGTDIASYSFAARRITDYGYAGAWTIAGIAIFFHLLAIGPRHFGIKAGAVVASIAAAVTVHTLFKVDARNQLGGSTQLTTLMPPELRLRAPRDADGFFADVDRLKATLDKARTDEPIVPALFPSLFDE